MELTEQGHAGGFIISKANGNRSFDNAVVASGAGMLQAGTVVTLDGTKYVPWDEDDSAAPPEGVLLSGVNATSADQAVAVLRRDAEVNRHELIWPTGITDNAKAAGIVELAALGIIVR